MTKAAKIVSIVVAALFAVIALLAVATQIGAFVLERKYPPVGRFVDVPGRTVACRRDRTARCGRLPIVMIHGASSSFETMRQPVGDRLAATHRVILIDRPGSGWSSRDRLSDTSPEIQARAISAALDQLGVSKAIIVVHSLAGALGARLALDDPNRVAGLVMLAPVAYPWPGGVGSYNDIVTTSVVGPLLAYTVTLPLGLLLLQPGVRAVFAPADTAATLC